MPLNLLWAILFCLLFLFPFFVFSQHHGGGSGGASPTQPAGAAAPAGQTSTALGSTSQSGATQVTQLHAYHIKRKRFMHYLYTTTWTDTTYASTPPTNVILETDYETARVIGQKVDSTPVPCTVSVPFDSITYAVYVCSDLKYITKLRTVIYTDSLYRYMNKTRLIAITQGDSGKLAVDLFRPTLDGPTPGVLTRNYNGYEHQAIRVQPGDQLNNFYLQVNPQINLGDNARYIVKHFWAWRLGALTIPYKYYFGGRKFTTPAGVLDTVPNNSTTSFNVNLAGGVQYGGTRFHYDINKSHNTASGMLVAFVGPTNISVSSSNTFHQTPNSTTEIGMSAGAGAMLQISVINLGAFVGWDIPFSSAGHDWYYADKMWLGFGVGINLTFFTGGTRQDTGENVGPPSKQ
jgi:hypothetical protein